MADPHWWLQKLQRTERICSWAGAVTVGWLFAWYELWPEPYGQIRALAALLLVAAVAVVLSILSWMGKFFLREIIDMEQSEKDWKEIQEGRWPND